MALVKVTDQTLSIGIVGYRCLDLPDPPPNPPLSDGPKPPEPWTVQPAPADSGTPSAETTTYTDSFGKCWSVTYWTFGGNLQPRVEKKPIDCADL